MNKRSEWIEPEEVTRERHARVHALLLHMNSLWLCCALPLSAAALIAVFFLDTGLELGQVLPLVIGILAVPFLSFAQTSLVMRLRPKLHERQCVLDAEDKQFWQHTKSFEITAHQTLPNVRILTILRSHQPHITQLNFRAGQLNEAELSTFVESQIANARTERLMRRIKM